MLDDTMRIYLDVDDLQTVEDHGTMWIMTGSTDDGKRVTFAGDWRPMRGLTEFLVANGEAVTDLEDWQVLAVE